MERAELEERRKSLGASDIAGVLGLGKYSTPLSVWYDKVEGKESSQSVAAELGLILEPWLLDKLATRLREDGHTMTVLGSQPHYTHAEHDILTATPDAWISVDGVEGGCECKTASEYRSSEWPDGGLPDEYYAQVQHQMACADWPWVYVPFLVGNRKFDVRFVPRNDEFIKVLIERAHDFWERFVLTKTPPAPTGADIDTDVLKALYPGGGDEVLRLDDMEDERETYKALARTIKAAQEEQKAIQQRFMARLGDNQLAYVGEHKVTWSTVNRKGYTVEPASYRQLRIN